MSTAPDAIWVIDAPAVAHPIAQALAQDLSRPVYALQLPDFPSQPSVLTLVEILLPHHSCGLTLASMLRAKNQCPTVAWSTTPAPLCAWMTWQIGLDGCLDKSQDWDRVLAQVTTLLEGQPVWPPDIWQTIHTFEATMGYRLRRLKESDWDRWLDLLCYSSMKQLASTWELSLRGTERAVTRLLETLSVDKREDAAALARQVGLVKEETDGPYWSAAIALYRARLIPQQPTLRP